MTETTVLTPPTVGPEAGDCTQLRAQLAKEIEKASKQRQKVESIEKFANWEMMP